MSNTVPRSPAKNEAQLLKEQVKGTIDQYMPISLQTKEKSKRVKAQITDLKDENSKLLKETKKFQNRINEEASVADLLQEEAHLLKKIVNEKDVEIKELGKTIFEQYESIKKLNEEIKNEQNNVSLQSSLKDELREKSNQLLLELTQVKDTLLLESQNHSQVKLLLKETEDKLETEIEQHKSNVNKFESEIKQLNQTINEKIQEIEKLNEKQMESNLENTKLNEEIEKLNLEIKQLNQDKETLESKYNSEIEKFENLQSLYNQLIEKNQELSQSLENEISIKIEFENKFQKLLEQHNQLELVNEKEKSINQQLEDDKKQLNESIEKLTNDNSVFQDEINQLLESKQSLLDSIQQLENDKLEIQQQRKHLENEKEMLESNIKTLTIELDDKVGLVDELTQLRDNLNLEIECVRKSHIKEMEELTLQVQQSQHQLEQDRIEIQSKDLEIKQMQQSTEQDTIEINDLKQKIVDRDQTISEKVLSIEKLESQLQEKQDEVINVSRSLTRVEFERDSLVRENQSIRDILSESSIKGLDELIASQKENYQKELQSLSLSILEKNNTIEDRDREIQQLKDSIKQLEQDIQDEKQNVEQEIKKREQDNIKFEEEKERLNRKYVEDQVDSEQAAEKVVSDLKLIIDNLSNERDTIQNEANNLAQRLSNSIDKSSDTEKRVKDLEKEFESMLATNDKMAKELEEYQQQLSRANILVQSAQASAAAAAAANQSLIADGANKVENEQQQQQLQKELNDAKIKNKEHEDRAQKERQTWESNHWEIVAELEQEKNKNKKQQEALLEERRRLGVVSKTVSKLLEANENESTSFESMTPESFYAMLEATKKELDEGLHHGKQYYADEDLNGQLLMEREARRLAESQVEHFAVLLEKSKSEILKYKEIINNGNHNNNNNNQKTGFFSNLINNSSNNSFIKRTFTGSTFGNQK